MRAWQAIARAGDRLPEPAVLFVLLGVLVVLASFVGARRHLGAVHPETNATIGVVSLLSGDGLRRLAAESVKSFASLPQIATVILVLGGLGFAERSGLVRVALSALGRRVPSVVLVASLFVASLHASLAGDTGLLLIPPLGALLFLGMGRSPMAGLAAGFAGVTSGYGAGFLWGSLDASLAASTAAAAGGGRSVSPAATYFFTCAATLALTVAGVIVSRRWVEPALEGLAAGASDDERRDEATFIGSDDGSRGAVASAESANRGAVAGAETGSRGAAAGGASSGEGRGEAAIAGGAPGMGSAEIDARALRFAGIAVVAVLVVIAALVGPEGGLLRDASGSPRPFFEALPAIALVTLVGAGAVFGHFSGSIRDQRAFWTMLGRAASDLGPYLVLAFVASQLLGALQASGLAPVLAIKGARAVGRAHLHGLPLAIGTFGLVAVTGLFLPSASARWGMMASALVPLFVASGYSPEAAQATFRAAMSPGLSLTPVFPYYVVLVAFAKRFEPGARAGTLVASTLPYALVFGLVWMVLLAIWLGAGLPLGPGVSVR